MGNGNETFRFHTRKPLRLTVLTFAQARIFTIPDTRGFNARYRVTRHGSETITPHPGECAGGGGGSSTPPPAPDCGTRSGGMDLELRSPGGQNVQVTEGDLAPLGFKHCPVASTAFPTIAISDSHGKFIQSKLPTRELLDRSLGKIIVLGHGIVRTTGGGTNATTRVSWTLTLTRIR